MKSLLTFHDIDSELASIDDIANTAINMNAHVHVLTIGLATVAPVSIYAQVPAYDYTVDYSKIIEDTQNKATELADYLAKLGVSATVVSICDSLGSIPTIAAEYALTTDFAVVPAADSSQANTNDIRKRFLEGVMFSAKTPTILIPKGKAMPRSLNNVVIGWHPSPNAAAAVRSCCPLLNSRTSVSIAIVDTSPATYGVSPGADLATFLSRHNVKSNIDLLSSNSIPIGKMLLQHSQDRNADLLVMGAYGRSRFKEWLMGGTTRDIFESLSIPALVSH